VQVALVHEDRETRRNAPQTEKHTFRVFGQFASIVANEENPLINLGASVSPMRVCPAKKFHSVSGVTRISSGW
jgi:hypothetical protein